MQSLLENSGIRDAVLRLDVDQYHRLCSSGIVPERTELLEGVVVEKIGKSPFRNLRCHIGCRAVVRKVNSADL
jgi:hypothetical protein